VSPFLEVIVNEDDRVALVEVCPDMGFRQFGADVEVLVVPRHFHPGAEAWHGADTAFDVDEIVAPSCA
jgi:hypothetical protein